MRNGSTKSPVMKLDEFARHLHGISRDAPEGRIIFFLGSGCSISSGIPGGSDLARLWLMRLAERDRESIAETGLASWVDQQFSGALKNPGAHYAAIGERLFMGSARLQHHEIERLTANKFPGHGYAVLAQFMAHHTFGPQANIVLTTNFDDLIADALYLYTDKRPMVLVHEKLFEFAIPSRSRPLIAKLHGDRLFASRNQQDEIDEQSPPIVNLLKKFTGDSALVITGYSGDDGSLLKALSACDPNPFSLGIFWVHGDSTVEDKWKAFDRFSFTRVDHRDFDSLMIRLADEFDLDTPGLDRAHQLRVRHKEALRKLDARFGNEQEWPSITKALSAQRAKQNALAIRDLTRLVTGEIRSLSEAERSSVFSQLVAPPDFATELSKTLAEAGKPQAGNSDPLSDADEVAALKDKIIHNRLDPRPHLTLALRLLGQGSSHLGDARHHLNQALEDELLKHDATAIGADAYLRALEQDVDISTWTAFERALSLEPDHRSNLVHYLIVLLADPKAFDFGPISAWHRGKQLLNRLFTLPWDDQPSTERFATLFCAAAFYKESFASNLNNGDRDWSDLFADESLTLGLAAKFLNEIPHRADTAEPENDGWASGEAISKDEFDDMEILLGQIRRITLNDEKPTMTRFAASFLSHTWPDKSLVRAVSTELGKRGVLTWFDENELRVGQDLPPTLEKAILDQATFSAFLSPQALAAPWVQTELEIALAEHESGSARGPVLPVYLGEPVDLVKQSALLASRWLHADGKRVTQYGIKVDPQARDTENAAIIASQIADAVFHALQAEHTRDVVIHLDQRGSMRHGFPKNIPASLQDRDGIGLVIRPAAGSGKSKETLTGEAWLDLASATSEALNSALGGVRWSQPKAIHMSGNAQLGLAYLIGHHFNRSSDAVLYCTDTRGTAFTNEGWDKTDMLHGGYAHSEANTDADLPVIPSTPFKEVVLIVSRKNVAEGVLPYLSATRPDTPIAWIRTPQLLETSDDVRTLVADITALGRRLNRENGCRKAYLVLGLPFAAVPLLAAHMQYVLDRFVLLEYRGDLPDAPDDQQYAELTFPS